MLFRSRRGNSGAVSPRQPATVAAAGGPSVYERPSSAPVSGVELTPSQSSPPASVNARMEEAQSVEERLSIVKRSRTASTSHKALAMRELGHTTPQPQRSPDPASLSLGTSPADAVDASPASAAGQGVAPPCSSYPTFCLSKLPKHEQHVMDALMREFTEVLFFPKDDRREREERRE